KHIPINSKIRETDSETEVVTYFFSRAVYKTCITFICFYKLTDEVYIQGSSPRPSAKSSGSEDLHSRGSPKVLFRQDGSLRVEFTNSRPELDDVPKDSTLRDSKGSSLSSEASWYDSPWGTGTDLCDNEDSGIGDSVLLSIEPKNFGLTSFTELYTNPNLTGPFPTTGILPTSHVQDMPDLQEEALETQAFTSLTLPCRKPVSDTNSRKDSLKSRIRRLSDWTGSLSRKKRRLQCLLYFGVPCMNLTSQVVKSSKATLLKYQIIQYVQQSQRQNVYENFKQELEPGGGCSSALSDALQAWEGDGEQGESSSGSLGSLEQMELLFEKEQGVVRRAGWLAFKPLISLHKERKLELLTRRRWRQYWVTLKGCTLLLSEANGKGCPEQEAAPRYALQAEDSIVQAVPEHPKKEHVFCLSNAYGDVYLFQAANQTDLENWVTAIHSASASHLAKRQGKEDTVRLLRNQSKTLLQKIDMDSKMKKMAELQLTVISDQKNRKAVESQIQQWEQNLEKFNMELFRMRCYLASLQGSEPPNPKNLLAAAGRPSKTALSRLGIFSVSSFHALMCTRDEATLKRRSRSLCRGVRSKRGIFSSQKGQDSLTRRNHEKRQSLSQVGLKSEAFVYVLAYYLKTCVLWLCLVCAGLRAGDEILAVNSVSVSTLDLGLIHTFFSQNTLQLVLRREECVSDDQSSAWPECDPADPYCPPPPLSHSHPQLGSLGVTSEAEFTTHSNSTNTKHVPCLMVLIPPSFLQSVEPACPLFQPFPEDPGLTVDGYRNPYSTESAPARASPRHMSVTERLHKVIQELVDTEKSYVKDLGCLFEIYLKPLERQTFLSHGEMESLFGSLPEMLDFQRIFLQTLEERTTSSPDFRTLETPEQLKKLLFSLGGSFLYYADHFKLYSGFCANHIKVQKVLERAKTDRAFKEFLEARNPTKQHSSTLESYLIKPVQRVLKYPLLLRELVSLTDPESEEHSHLTEALRAMEKVASHINEMQKIYEDYGTVFDQLVAEQSSTEREVTEISMGEFIIHSSALWLNPMPSLGRMRKDPQLTLFIFKRAVILVYRESNSRSADLDPFKFRWLIPASSVQVRPGNSAGSEDPCLWELIHTKSEVEGRPETVFQLCSSNLENKANAVKALRSILRENAKRNVPAERGSRDNLTFPRRSHPAAVRSSSWLQRLQPQSDALKRSPLDTDEGRLLGIDTQSEPACAPRTDRTDTSHSKRARLCSLTSSLEAQLQRLSFMDPQETRLRTSSSLQASQLTLLQDTSALDLNNLLTRDCSVQNLNSVPNEDCFYDTVMGIQKAVIPTL
uniref:TIAM Rac1 associated GEF 2b n=2 Tax=Astyanax mexicanus TaxID=7994 RepID=A0A8B9K5Q7_ASTMX